MTILSWLFYMMLCIYLDLYGLRKGSKVMFRLRKGNEVMFRLNKGSKVMFRLRKVNKVMLNVVSQCITADLCPTHGRSPGCGQHQRRGGVRRDLAQR